MRIGWLRLVGSLKLQVSFAKEPYKRDDILPKRLIISRSLLIVATPHHTTALIHAAMEVRTAFGANSRYGVATISRLL